MSNHPFLFRPVARPVARSVARSVAALAITSAMTAGARAQPSAPAEQPSVRLPITAGGLTADAAARAAIAASPSLAVARQSLGQSTVEAKVAAAAFFPRLDLRASTTRLGEIDQQPIRIGEQEFSLSPQILNNTVLHAGLSFPVSDYFLTIAPGYQASKKAAAIAAYQLAAEQQATAFAARQLYYGYVRAVAAEQVAVASVEQLTAHVADLEALVAAGTTTRGDLLQAQAQLASAQVQLAAARGAVRTGGDQLRSELGLAADASLSLGEDVMAQPTSEPSLAPSQAQPLYAAAEKARPEVAALRTLIEANQLNAKVQAGRRWPTISLTAGYDFANPNARAFPQEEKFTGSWSAGVVASWSPNDAIVRKADVGRAELEVSRARAELVELSRRLRNEASQAANDLVVAAEQIRAARQGVDSAREAFRVQRDLLGAGEATEQAVLDAQAAQSRAEQALVDAHIASRIASARADYVAGAAAGADLAAPQGKP